MESDDGIIRVDLKPVSGASAAGGEGRPVKDGDTMIATAYVRNLSLGSVLGRPIKFNFKGHVAGELQFEIFNDDEVFLYEQKLAEYHTKSERNDIRYNPRLSIHTAWIKVCYLDYCDSPDASYSILNEINIIVRIIFARLLTFFQRRRISFGFVPAFPSRSHCVWAGTSADSESIADSVGWGKVAISPDNLETALQTALLNIEGSDERMMNKISMLLLRYNESLNLVYAHERSEALWRIMEVIGADYPDTEESEEVYNRIREELPRKQNGASAKSNTLKIFINSLVGSGVDFNDAIVIKAFEFRNAVIHEYLNPKTLFNEDVPEIFNFLNKVVELVILLSLQLPKTIFKGVVYDVHNGQIVFDRYEDECI